MSAYRLRNAICYLEAGRAGEARPRRATESKSVGLDRRPAVQAQPDRMPCIFTLTCNNWRPLSERLGFFHRSPVLPPSTPADVVTFGPSLYDSNFFTRAVSRPQAQLSETHFDPAVAMEIRKRAVTVAVATANHDHPDKKETAATMAGTTELGRSLHALIFFSVLILFPRKSTAGIVVTDTLSSGGNITDGETLVSSGGTFTLGFFSPTGVPAKRYLGIWFTASPPAVCWVANRDVPLNTTTGVLVISSSGSLHLLDGTGRTTWSSNTTSASGVAAQLLESGNFVVRDEHGNGDDDDDIIWQSFDHPSNTLLAGQRLGKNPETGAEWSLTSWRAPNDPTPGDCRRVMDTNGLPDCVSWQGDVKKYRTGPWNGLWFSGVPEMSSYSEMFTNDVIVKPDEVAYVFNATPGAPLSRLVLSEVGVLQRLAWDPASRVWNVFAQAPRDVCDGYAMCGVFGTCDVNTASTLFCSCLQGFSPAAPAQWAMRESSGGCRRKAPLECGGGGNGTTTTTTTDGFVVVRGVKLPDTDNATVDMGATVEQCRERCLGNCSCVAYAAADIRGGGDGSGCVMWMNDIVDVRYVDKGQDLYLRLAKSELAKEKRGDVLKIMLPVTAFVLALTALGMYLVWICRLRVQLRNKENQKKMMLGYFSGSEFGDENLELPFFSFGDVITATNNFSGDNMLGQGGFGKGMLDENKEVAIKRLCQSSGQGVEEFRNEVVLIAKLQHRNLVRLLGCCIHGDEKLLIYEYLPNKSLDFFIFSSRSSKEYQGDFFTFTGIQD
ncbi:hypothetical protein PR202_gb14244 [Eleusine coracana subsp. coracana]|uniref:non-specific serine/threonine protein kinase n=1 Tax=Eleusine coracana subsp. coracana TaxID=191504 RepID=A0AAV5EUR3_ELECO|nr:hypothetical protein PR202_gb14244 [Eleusine coracana subsp. coracana]